jgi:hypothetical protein
VAFQANQRIEDDLRILFLGKRYYTRRDALCERFGRIYQLPLQWHRAGNTAG